MGIHNAYFDAVCLCIIMSCHALHMWFFIAYTYVVCILYGVFAGYIVMMIILALCIFFGSP